MELHDRIALDRAVSSIDLQSFACWASTGAGFFIPAKIVIQKLFALDLSGALVVQHATLFRVMTLIGIARVSLAVEVVCNEGLNPLRRESR